MKKYILIGSILLNAGLMMAQKLTPMDEGSSVKFAIKNFGVNVNGSFSGMNGEINFDQNASETSSFNITIDAATINTGIDMRDEHLRKPEYFDVQNFPKLKFISTKISKGRKDGTYNITGNLTIRDVTREISFPFTAVEQGSGYKFEGEFKINRRDFNVGGGSLTLSDHVTVNLSVFAKK